MRAPDWWRWTADRLWRDRAVLRALLADPATAVAIVGAGGALRQVSPGLQALSGDSPSSLAALLGDSTFSQLAAAGASRVALSMEADITTAVGRVPVALGLTPTGLAEPVAVLHLHDRSRERQLEELLRQAQRLQTIGQLAGGIAHDFNNLLSAILGTTEDLAARAGSDEDRADIGQIRQSAERGAALVKQILAFGRQQTLQPQSVAVNDAVEAASVLLRRLLGSNINLVLSLERPGRHVRVDPTQLDQVLVNLAVNARDAMAAGGTLTVTTGHRLVLQALPAPANLPAGRYATIEMRDTGVGMTADILSRIFEPFFTTRRDAGGTGLGLSTVHGIVRQSGGYLDVESTPGQGSCFRIILPRDEAVVGIGPVRSATVAAVDCSVGPSRASSTRTVLLVEDEAPLRRLAGRALTKAGWDVISAASALEALVCDLPRLDCVVSDVMMPGMDGLELVRRLRRDRPSLPAVLVSGYADAAQRARLIDDEIHFLAKPFPMRDLVAAVAHAISQPKPDNGQRRQEAIAVMAPA